jgi:hypothetical protein
VAKSKADQAREQELVDKIDKACVEADAAVLPGFTRVGSVTAANARLVSLLVEETFNAVAPLRKRELIGSLNEVLCFLGAVKKRLTEEEASPVAEAGTLKAACCAYQGTPQCGHGG